VCHNDVSQWYVTMMRHNDVSQWCVTMMCHNGVTMMCHNGVSVMCHDVSQLCVTVVCHNDVSMVCHIDVSQWCVTMHALPYCATRRTLFDAERQIVVVKWKYNLVYRMSKFQMSVQTFVILRCFRGFPHSLQAKARHISSHTH
jgi:hypothetical protein